MYKVKGIQFLLLLVSFSASAEIYKCTIGGKVQFSDEECGGQKIELKETNSSIAITDYPEPKIFSHWMESSKLDRYFDRLNSYKPGKNYFQRGHRINYVEGRWNEETKTTEYRVSVGKTPKGSYWWWFYGISRATFSEKLDEYEAMGATLVYSQNFTMPNGTKKYQAVWHKEREKGT